MLPQRASKADIVPGGSAKSLGLVRVDSESTATVSREPATNDKAEKAWTDGSETLDRKSKPAPEPVARATDDQNDDDGEEPDTVLKGQQKIVLPDAAPAPKSEEAHASSDDDDLNETRRANEQEGPATPGGLKKPAPADVAAPESGQTRVAPIVVPTATAAASLIKHTMGPKTTPAQGWAMPPSALPPAPQGIAGIVANAAKALKVPPQKLQKIAAIAAMGVMVAVLTFVFVRAHQPAPAPAASTSDLALFPPPVEVLPPATTVAPPATLVLPPPAPTWTAQAQAQPRATKPASPPVHRTPPRATSRTSIPAHREQ